MTKAAAAWRRLVAAEIYRRKCNGEMAEWLAMAYESLGYVGGSKK
jgi:hypothetical protein